MSKNIELTDGDFDARIVIDITNDAFTVLHTSNMDVLQVYAIFVAAVEYMEASLGDQTPPKFLN